VIRHATRFGLPDGYDWAKWYQSGGTDPMPNVELGLARAKAATLLILALPGSTYMYQGEELGLPEHAAIPSDQMQDPQCSETRARLAAAMVAACLCHGAQQVHHSDSAWWFTPATARVVRKLCCRHPRWQGRLNLDLLSRGAKTSQEANQRRVVQIGAPLQPQCDAFQTPRLMGFNHQLRRHSGAPAKG